MTALQLGYSSPAESGIMEDLDLSIAAVCIGFFFVMLKFEKLCESFCVCMIDSVLRNVQYSVFGSMMTVGGMLGGLVNGKLADLTGRKAVRFTLFLCSNSLYELPILIFYPFLVI